MDVIASTLLILSEPDLKINMVFFFEGKKDFGSPLVSIVRNLFKYILCDRLSLLYTLLYGNLSSLLGRFKFESVNHIQNYLQQTIQIYLLQKVNKDNYIKKNQGAAKDIKGR